ncbi:MAG: hypothetical protein K2G77_07505 [Muribaculaceae bacterium]|nr:hypothetical protein [Muribaculaceae bacterium]
MSQNDIINISKSKNQKHFYLITTIITGVLFAILISLTPAGADDLLFMVPMKGHEAGFGLWGMMIERIPWIWETQSGRLGNFLAMPFLYLAPKCIFGILSGIVIILLIMISCRVCGARYGSIVSWLLYATFVLAFPWYDYLTLVTYAINYLWAATAVAGAIYCYLNIKKYEGIRLGLACVLMFIAGWIHEGFGAPLCAAITICLILNRKQWSGKQIAAWISLCAGTSITIFSPIFWQRSDRTTNYLLKFTYKEALMQLGPAFIFIIAFIILLIWILVKCQSRQKILKSTTLMLLIIASIGSAAVFLKYYTGPRTGAPVMLYCALGCGYILSSVSSSRQSYDVIQWIIGIVISVFSIVHLVYTDIKQRECNIEYDEVTRLYQESKDGIFYYDLTYSQPDLTLFKTSIRQFHEKVPKEFMRIYFAPDNKMVILPTDMQGFSPDKSKQSDQTPGAMIYNGWIVITEDLDIDTIQRIGVITENGENIPSRFRIDRFFCPGYGYYLLITPHIKVLDQTIMIKDVVLNDDSR